MDKNETKKIIEIENLKNFNFFENRSIGANETVIIKNGNHWEVFVTSEKGGKGGEKIFTTESEALIDFINRLRAGKEVEEYFKQKGLR